MLDACLERLNRAEANDKAARLRILAGNVELLLPIIKEMHQKGKLNFLNEPIRGASMADKYSVLIKYKYLEYIESANLSNDDAWTFMKSIIEYDSTGVIPKYENPILSWLFVVVKIDLDKNRENYEAVSEARSDAGKEGAKKRWKGKNSKNGKCHEAIAKMANANEDGNCHEIQKNMAKMHDLDLDSDLDYVNINYSPSVDDSQTVPQKPDKPKKPPLREREPENGMEQVEKAYLANWDLLFSQKIVRTPDPVANWGQTRKLLKTHFEKLKPKQIIQAVNNGMKDDWVMKGGYSLGMILSASVLNRLINAAQAESPVSKHRREKLTFE